MSEFAIVEHARQHDPAGVLMLLDDRAEADAIVAELRRRGQEVDLRELRSGKAS
jgi:hypothetical protein